MSPRYLLRGIVGFLCVFLPFAKLAQSQTAKPNVVFILVDNVGWGNFGVYGGTVPTPRIDKLASEGIRFNNYNVEVQCTPSRSAIMTGRHPVRSGTYKVPLPGEGKAGMAPWEYTIAKLLSDAGYATALYGKWHLGNTQGRLPKLFANDGTIAGIINYYIRSNSQPYPNATYPYPWACGRIQERSLRRCKDKL